MHARWVKVRERAFSAAGNAAILPRDTFFLPRESFLQAFKWGLISVCSVIIMVLTILGPGELTEPNAPIAVGARGRVTQRPRATRARPHRASSNHLQLPELDGRRRRVAQPREPVRLVPR
jgi:hypothetical protein